MFVLAQYQILLAAVANANSPQLKGKAFEDLCKYFLDSISGVEVQAQDLHLPSEEIDLVVYNAQIAEELRLFDSVFYVECKNWSEAVGAPVLDNFIGKLRRKMMKVGILIAAHGVTGAYDTSGARGARGIIAAAMQEGYRVITLTLADLQVIQDEQGIRDLLKRRYCGLFLGKLMN